MKIDTEAMAMITHTIGTFSLAFGSEDGAKFCALLWPEAEGDMPFVTPPNMRMHLDGFVLFDSLQEHVIGCFGIDPESRAKISTHQMVILVKDQDGYGQTEVIAHSDSPRINLA